MPNLGIKILGDEHDLLRAYASATRSAKKFASETESTLARSANNSAAAFNTAFSKSGRRDFFAGAVGGATVLAATQIASTFATQGAAAVSVASNLAEQTSKAQQVFAEFAPEVQEWATTTASAFGIAEDAALEAAGSFGNLFKTVDIAAEPAAEMSRVLVELAADLASFNNADPGEALVALRSGLIGEAEPLRRFGVLLSEARVQQEAMAATGKKSAKELTNQEKALARYRIILTDTNTAQGDFQRTSSGLANQQRILSANIRDLQADIGAGLIPALSPLVSLLAAATEGFGKLGAAIKSLPGAGFIDDAFNIASGKFLFDKVRGDGDEGNTGIASRGRGIPRPVAGSEAEDRARVLVTKLPNRLKEDLLDARIATPDFYKDDLEVLRRQKREILAALDDDRLAVGQRVSLKGDLEGVSKAIDAIQEGFAARVKASKDAARQAAVDAKADAISQAIGRVDRADLGIERAAINGPGRDDLNAIRNAEAAVREQIRVEGRTVDLERKLFQLRQQRVEVRKQMAAQAAQDTQVRQFKALGLDAGGNELAPGVNALKQELAKLDGAIEGTFLDTNKTRSLIQSIKRVLAGGLGEVGADVRRTVDGILDDLDRQLGDRQQGPQTKFGKTSANQILAGLGLDPASTRELRARLSQVGAGGTVPKGGQGAFGFASPRSAAPSSTPVVVHATSVLEVDGQRMAQVTTTHQRQSDKRNPVQKRGPFAGQR